MLTQSVSFILPAVMRMQGLWFSGFNLPCKVLSLLPDWKRPLKIAAQEVLNGLAMQTHFSSHAEHSCATDDGVSFFGGAGVRKKDFERVAHVGGSISSPTSSIGSEARFMTN